MSEQLVTIGLALDSQQLQAGAQAAAASLRALEQAGEHTTQRTKLLQTGTSQAAEGVRALGTAVGATVQQVRGLPPGLARVTETEQRLEQQTRRTADALRQSGQAATGTSGLLAGLGRQVATLAAGYLSFQAAVGAVRSLVQATTQSEGLSAALRGITGSSRASGEALGFIRQQAQRLGLDFVALAEGYKLIAAASRGTTLEGDKTREIFLAIAEAGRVYQLSTEQVQGALLAVSQMLSKGTVSAEELRGQLGERLPGAFQVAARAMGVTTAELDKMLATGQVVATDFLPKLGAQFRKELGSGVEEATKTAGTAFARFQNALRETGQLVGPSVVGPLAKAAESLTSLLKTLTATTDEILKQQGRLQASGATDPGLNPSVALLTNQLAMRQQALALLEKVTPAGRQQMPVLESLRTEIAQLTAQREALQQVGKDQGELQQRWQATEAITPATGLAPGDSAIARIKAMAKDADAALAAIDRKAQAGLPAEDALTEKLKVREKLQVDMYDTLVRQPGVFILIRKAVDDLIAGNNQQLVQLQEQIQLGKDREKQQAQAARQAEQDREKAANRETAYARVVGDAERQVAEEKARFEQQLLDQLDEELLTEEERFRKRAEGLGFEGTALARILTLHRQVLAAQEARAAMEARIAGPYTELAETEALGFAGLGRAMLGVTPESALTPPKKTPRGKTEWQELEDAGKQTLRNLTSELLEFTRTGKFEFEAFVQSATSSLLRLGTDQLVEAAFDPKTWQTVLDWGRRLAHALGGTGSQVPLASPAVQSPGVTVPSRDSGGPVTAGKPYWIGLNRQPELFIPHTSGTVVPAAQGASSAPALTNHFHIYAQDAPSVIRSRSEIARAMGQALEGTLRHR